MPPASMILTRYRIVTPHHDKTGCKAGHTFPYRFRSRQLVARVHGEPDRIADSRSAAALGAVELPHGVLWWHDRQHSVYQHDVYHGQDFVLQRQRSGGPGLVLSHRLSSMQIVDKVERERVQLEMYNKGQDNVGAQLALSDTFTFDLTDYALVEEAAADAEAHTDPPLHFPPTTCTGIVLSVQSGQATHQVRFTCKRCGTTNMKAVNPHAWATGTVFGRCDGCQVIHKLTDNLELFHELGSLIENPPNLRSVKIPDGLPQKPYMP